MDLITLDADNQESKLIENYDHLLWTERYTSIGDFQLITGNLNFIDLLPEGTVVSLRDSTVPMIVERHKIVRKKNQPVQLTIKGRDYCSILDRRVSIKQVIQALDEWLVVAKIPSDVAHYIIYKICVEGVLDPKDIFPGEKVQFLTPDDYLTSTGPARQYSVPRGNLLATVMSYLQTEAKDDLTTDPVTPAVEQHGIRAMRPNSLGTAVGIEIYVGQDRSGEIIFDASRDLLDDGSYLFSKENSATDAYVISENAAYKLNKGDVPAEGLDRRVRLVEASSSNAEAAKNEGIRVLSDAHETAIFDGSINQDLSPYIYNVHYNLGDKVTLLGDYGLAEKARVTEYIRSEDNTGTKSYPTLVAIDQEALGD